MGRAYLRLDPDFFDRKAIDQGYPAGAIAALVGTICHAEHQPKRGRYRDARVLRALLGPHAKWIDFLIEKGDLAKRGAELYVDGWDEWQEGDWKVGERVRRIRNRRAVTPEVTADVTVPTVTGESVGTVYIPSDDGRLSVIDSGGGKQSGKRTPQPPASGGPPSRANGTSPRQVAKAEADAVDREAAAKRHRATERRLAYARGALTEQELEEQSRRDAPLSEIPDWAEQQERRKAEEAPAWAVGQS